MKLENAGWGAPKIHGELLSSASKSLNAPSQGKGLRPRTGKHGQCWKAFLANHRETIVAFDFFAVPR
jgi:hypothetical protein